MYVIASFYHFFDFPDYGQKRAPLLALLKSHGIKGSLLIAAEGINGTLSGTRDAIDVVLRYLKTDIVRGEFEHKESLAERQPFARCKVRLKKEVISLGVYLPSPLEGEGKGGGSLRISPAEAGATTPPPTPSLKGRGKYVSPEAWNALIADPGVTLLDSRNTYEVHLGTFEGAVDPNIRTFRQLPDFVRKNLAPDKHKKIATFCTGGIRCEKFSAWLLEEGFEEVYQLKGGILKYLEEMPEDKSKWQGECYVFDERVAVGHGLTPSASATLCKGCGHALTPEDRIHPLYMESTSCPHCENKPR